MVFLSTWVRYAASKFEYSVSLGWKKYNVGQINAKEFSDAIWKNFFQGKLTFLHWTKGGEEVAPLITGQGATLLVRKMAVPVPTRYVLFEINQSVKNFPIDNR